MGITVRNGSLQEGPNILLYYYFSRRPLQIIYRKASWRFPGGETLTTGYETVSVQDYIPEAYSNFSYYVIGGEISE